MRKLTDKEKLDRRIRHLMLSTHLEESGSPGLVIYSTLFTCIMIATIFIWAAYTDFAEISSAKGVVSPVGKIQVLQHLEGGIISDVLVNDGSLVEKGTVLVELSPEPTLTEFNSLKSRANVLVINMARVMAYLEEKELHSQEIYHKIPYKEVENTEHFSDFLQYTRSLLHQKNQKRINERNILMNKISKAEEDVEHLTTQILNNESRVKLLTEEYQMYQKLEKLQSAPYVKLIEVGEKMKDVNGELLELAGQKKAVLRDLNEAKDKLASSESDFQSEALTELTTYSEEILQVKSMIKKAMIQLSRLQVIAPVKGIVKGLSIRPGSIVTPGGVICDLVPMDEPLIVEAEIVNRDIGHIQVGDKVSVKVDTFDFASYGDIPGLVDQISAATFVNDDNVAYYKAIIKLDKGYLGENPQRFQIMPGMTVMADIQTDKKSLLKYFLKPINRSLDTVFTER